MKRGKWRGTDDGPCGEVTRNRILEGGKRVNVTSVGQQHGGYRKDYTFQRLTANKKRGVLKKRTKRKKRKALLTRKLGKNKGWGPRNGPSKDQVSRSKPENGSREESSALPVKKGKQEGGDGRRIDRNEDQTVSGRPELEIAENNERKVGKPCVKHPAALKRERDVRSRESSRPERVRKNVSR